MLKNAINRKQNSSSSLLLTREKGINEKSNVSKNTVKGREHLARINKV